MQADKEAATCTRSCQATEQLQDAQPAAEVAGDLLLQTQDMRTLWQVEEDRTRLLKELQGIHHAATQALGDAERHRQHAQVRVKVAKSQHTSAGKVHMRVCISHTLSTTARFKARPHIVERAVYDSAG